MRIRGTVLEFVSRTEDKSQTPSVRRGDCVYTSGGDCCASAARAVRTEKNVPRKVLGGICTRMAVDGSSWLNKIYHKFTTLIFYALFL